MSKLAEERRLAFERPLQSITAMLEASSGSEGLKKYTSRFLDTINDGKAFASASASGLAFAKPIEPTVREFAWIEPPPEVLFPPRVEGPAPRGPTAEELAQARLEREQVDYTKWCDDLPFDREGRLLLMRPQGQPMVVISFQAEEGGFCRVFGTVNGNSECDSLHYLNLHFVQSSYKPKSPGAEFDSKAIH